MKNKERLQKIVIGVIVVVAVIGYGVYMRMTGATAPKVVIDGKEFSTDDKVQDLLDAGFLISKDYGKTACDTEKLADIEGKTYTSEWYYVGIKGEQDNYEYTGIKFSVYNTSVNSTSFNNSAIYEYIYEVDLEEKPCTVTVNGIDFSGMSKEEAVAAFEENKLSFDEDDKEEFLQSEDGVSLYGKPKNYFYILVQEEGKLSEVDVKKNIH